MITKEKLEIYNKYKGNNDWSRLFTEEEKKLYDENDWGIIDGLIQDIIIVKNKFASKNYTENLQKRLIENCSTEEVINQIVQIADEAIRHNP